MRFSGPEFYETLPPAVRKDVALRLLESREVADQESIDDAWTGQISSRVDDLHRGGVQTIPGERVFADIAARRAARATSTSIRKPRPGSLLTSTGTTITWLASAAASGRRPCRGGRCGR